MVLSFHFGIDHARKAASDILDKATDSITDAADKKQLERHHLEHLAHQEVRHALKEKVIRKFTPEQRKKIAETIRERKQLELSEDAKKPEDQRTIEKIGKKIDELADAIQDEKKEGIGQPEPSKHWWERAMDKGREIGDLSKKLYNMSWPERLSFVTQKAGELWEWFQDLVTSMGSKTLSMFSKVSKWFGWESGANFFEQLAKGDVAVLRDTLQSTANVFLQFTRKTSDEVMKWIREKYDLYIKDIVEKKKKAAKSDTPVSPKEIQDAKNEYTFQHYIETVIAPKVAKMDFGAKKKDAEGRPVIDLKDVKEALKGLT